MNKDKREPIYPVELESQFILRLPEEPANTLRELLESGENLKNRLAIQIDNDMRHGEVRLDHWLLHGRIMDLPTIVESLKTVDRKSVYKTADICQIMICKTEKDSSVEEESPVKNKKKDPLKVDKKYLFPHGITPPTKNVRKRRFRKTLRKKSMEGPEIEREVKRLLRADNEAVSVTWEVVQEEEEHNFKPESAPVSDKKNDVKERKGTKPPKTANEASKVEDIFGGALSDSDVEDDNNIGRGKGSNTISYDDQLSDTNSLQGPSGIKESYGSTQLKLEMFESSDKTKTSREKKLESEATSSKEFEAYTGEDTKVQWQLNLQKLANDLEELKLRRQRTRHEIAGMENMTLRQRFQEILHSLNRDINFKEKEYKKLQSHSH